ncbi:HU family DNA-binding protein [Parabacteroides sp. AM08-6]|uniref:HU family DNA-binding protein n=1 Tax=Parabacteroides sp. AM08-6 TaxID=2292053 RepID=UPI001314FD9A|nr:HU family DNA-binding protein [Parabacteroides sp. AM08-6]
MKYRKETVKSSTNESTRYYLVQKETVSLREVAKRIETKRNVSAIDTMRVLWNFFEEITPMLADGSKIEITDFCTLSAIIRKDKDGKPKAGIQLNTSGVLKKAMAKVQLKECLSIDKPDI